MHRWQCNFLKGKKERTYTIPPRDHLFTTGCFTSPLFLLFLLLFFLHIQMTSVVQCMYLFPPFNPHQQYQTRKHKQKHKGRSAYAIHSPFIDMESEPSLVRKINAAVSLCPSILTRAAILQLLLFTCLLGSVNSLRHFSLCPWRWVGYHSVRAIGLCNMEEKF